MPPEAPEGAGAPLGELAILEIKRKDALVYAYRDPENKSALR